MKLSVEKGELLEDVIMYRCVVGTLIYMTITRPYIELCCGVGELVYASTKGSHIWMQLGAY